MKYKCKHTLESGKELCWDSDLSFIDQHGSYIEFELSGKGSYFHAIIGPQENGHFICIPNWKVGCELGNYEDLFWNLEQLYQQLTPIDSVTVANGIYHLSILLKDNHSQAL